MCCLLFIRLFSSSFFSSFHIFWCPKSLEVAVTVITYSNCIENIQIDSKHRVKHFLFSYWMKNFTLECLPIVFYCWPVGRQQTVRRAHFPLALFWIYMRLWLNAYCRLNININNNIGLGEETLSSHTQISRGKKLNDKQNMI